MGGGGGGGRICGILQGYVHEHDLQHTHTHTQRIPSNSCHKILITTINHNSQYELHTSIYAIDIIPQYLLSTCIHVPLL